MEKWHSGPPGSPGLRARLPEASACLRTADAFSALQAVSLVVWKPRLLLLRHPLCLSCSLRRVNVTDRARLLFGARGPVKVLTSLINEQPQLGPGRRWMREQ